MKTFAALALVSVVLVMGLLYVLATADNRAKFTGTKRLLIEAHLELQTYGAFTNHFRDVNLYPYTNLFSAGDATYQCEFAAERAEFKGRGFLTITTNRVFVWVDKERGIIPLDGSRTLPPGF